MSTIESVIIADSNAPASGQADGADPSVPPSSSPVVFEQFVSDFRKYEMVLVSDILLYCLCNRLNVISQDRMIKATSDTKFKQEIATIEQCS